MANRVLVIDIETKPAVAYVWSLFNENISLDKLISPGGTLCFGAKWLGEKSHVFYSEWEHGTEAMVKAAHALFEEADAIITYNGDKFDIPKLMGEFVSHGLTPPPPPTSIDVYKTVKKLGFQSGKLGFVGPFLRLGAKVKHEGFSLWSSVLDGDAAARKRMEKYCVQDVKLLELVYQRLKPYITNHPHLGKAGGQCPQCQSTNLQSRGYRRTRMFKIQRVQCQDCGGWHTGKKEAIK